MMTVSSEKDMQESYKLFEKKGEKGISYAGLKETFDKAEVHLSN